MDRKMKLILMMIGLVSGDWGLVGIPNPHEA
jgi:hypothetical protein